MLLHLLVLLLTVSDVLTKKTKTSEIIHIDDLKDWKKELRTKNNVLALFTKVRKFVFRNKLFNINIIICQLSKV